MTREEKSKPGHKPMKDRFTLLLCGNASGDCKIKLLLVYHSENPRAFKANNIMKSKLTVMWRTNSKAWLTRQFCTEWMHEVFDPEVKKYLEEKNLPLCCLWLMDNAPANPPGLEVDFMEEFNFIKIKFLPPNTTPLQPDLVDDIVSVGESLGLEIDNDDVEELLDEHQAELTTEELLYLQNEQKKKLEEEMSSEEEEARKDAPTSEIKQMCSKWA